MKSFIQTPLIQEGSMRRKMGAIYARVSSDQQKENETIDSQIEILIKLCKESGYETPSEWTIRDEAESGPSLDRPGLDLIRDLAYEGALDAIFVYSPDRLARKFVYQLILEEEFQKAGVQVFYFKSKSQGNTPEDNLLIHCQAMFAEYEHAQILDRTRRGKLYKVRRGIVSVLPKAPYGYFKERGPLFYTIKQDEAKVVTEIFRLYIQERLSIRQISRKLEEKGIKAPRGGASWDSKTLQGILNNTAYIGTAYFGKTEKCEGSIERTVRYKGAKKIGKSTKAKKARPKELWEPLTVPKFINENDFEIAQTLLKKNKELASRNTKEPSILQGLLVCGLCGCSFYKKRRVKNGKDCTYYNCHSALVKGKTTCGNRSFRQEILDKLVWDNIVELLKNPQLIESEIVRRSNEEAASKPHINERISVLQREEKQLEKAHNKLLDAYQEGECLSLEQLRERSKALKERTSLIKKEIESLEALSMMENGYQNITRTLKMFEDKLDMSFGNLSIKEKQIVARSLIADVIILPDNLEIKHAIPVLDRKKSLLCGVDCVKPIV